MDLVTTLLSGIETPCAIHIQALSMEDGAAVGLVPAEVLYIKNKKYRYFN
jgi:hypothetical protein